MLAWVVVSSGGQVPNYCSISFKSTLGVTRDPKNHFDISTTAKIWRNTSEIFDIRTKIWAFLCPTVNFELCDAREVRQSPA
jgi:nuclear transport factor 2 (NTF2) superfamily protein